MKKELTVGTEVKHKLHGFEGVVAEVHDANGHVTVEITKGEHPYSNSRKTFISKVESLVVIEQDSFDKMLHDLFNEIIKAEKQPSKPVEEAYEMEIEAEGMTIRTDFVTFKKIVTFMNTIKK